MFSNFISNCSFSYSEFPNIFLGVFSKSLAADLFHNYGKELIQIYFLTGDCDIYTNKSVCLSSFPGTACVWTDTDLCVDRQTAINNNNKYEPVCNPSQGKGFVFIYSHIQYICRWLCKSQCKNIKQLLYRSIIDKSLKCCGKRRYCS